jgi:hypothetical protein
MLVLVFRKRRTKMGLSSSFKHRERTSYIFTFGNVEAGKSTLIASIAYYLSRTDKVLFRFNVRNKAGTTILLRDWLQRLSKGEFPPQTPKGEFVEVDFGIEDFDDNERLGITFFEISGEDLREIDMANYSGQFPKNIQDFIKVTDIVLIVVPCDKATGEDLLVAQFFETLLSYEVSRPTALVISKWDLLNQIALRPIDFIRDNMPLTYNWLRTDRLSDMQIFPFSVGIVDNADNQRAKIIQFNPEDSENLIAWIHEILTSE